jgi:hypothetical protein
MLLPVQVTFRNLTDSVGLEEMVEKEVAKLEHFYDRITSCRVMVECPQRAIHKAFQQMRRQLQDYARRQDGFVKSTPKLAEAQVKQVFPEQGFGFLKTTDDREIY